MHAIVHAADIQDRDGGILLMATLFGLYPFLLKLYADGGYQGPKFQQGLARVCREVNVEIVRRCDAGKFVVLPKRWIVERTIAWLNRCRRLSKDWECLIPIASNIDPCPISGADRAYACWIAGEPVPGLAAGVDDLLVAIPNEGTELVGTKVFPDIFHRV